MSQFPKTIKEAKEFMDVKKKERVQKSEVLAGKIQKELESIIIRELSLPTLPTVSFGVQFEIDTEPDDFVFDMAIEIVEQWFEQLEYVKINFLNHSAGDSYDVPSFSFNIKFKDIDLAQTS